MSRLSLSLTIMLAATFVLFSFSLAFASEPAANSPFPPMSNGALPGNVSGRVTTQDVNVSIPDVYVALQNASNRSIVYATTRTDAVGNYSFSGVNSTNGHAAYKTYVFVEGVGDGYSNAFEVESSGNAFATLIVTIPTGYSTPSPSPTPSPPPTLSPTLTPTPLPSSSATPTSVPTSVPTAEPGTPTPRPSDTVTTGTPAPVGSSTSQPTPGFEVAIAIISLAGAMVIRRLR